MTVTILVSIACFIIGGFLSYMFFKHGLKSKYDNILKEAEAEAEVIKKNKLLGSKGEVPEQKSRLGERGSDPQPENSASGEQVETT